MNRFFVDRKNIIGDQKLIVLDDPEDVKHIIKVLRLAEEDILEVCDGEKGIYIGEILSLSKTKIELKILEKFLSDTEPPIEVTLFQGMPKGTKMEIIIQKCTELGIHSIIPLNTARTVVQLKDKKDEVKKIERWQKIAEEAAKQSKRGVIPQIGLPINFSQLRDVLPLFDLVIIPYEKETVLGLKTLLKEQMSPKKIAVIIGPEGGFEETEIEIAKELGSMSISLGKRILRTETAGFVVLSTLMYELGDLGGI
ncbi:16S rRNA (uracil(1498)-N(3))-methyltransferase [Geosporobacter ferrireducens]|uniref:Ribosomal RNA small subunit methyltransferase E n=1 Tax=Geosporobacter ferrireducens TaxID=1424294 RepID=A0A1D8GCC1_9FIRM|nr:16S rRNA (uracil(1498)-N(3))-methyltransferase [Geosporobacter ferrireducens]AOT68530.1 16S rRNA methyltransferase [Geosporobacter ferrireducens]MTI53995.1 16S rRNA (uracil(1498)-N(3))-methyltransferase [Geosporobacter ferrireducens]